MLDVRLPLDLAQALALLAETYGVEPRDLLEVVVRDFLERQASTACNTRIR